jgi:hypothetical protein
MKIKRISNKFAPFYKGHIKHTRTHKEFILNLIFNKNFNKTLKYLESRKHDKYMCVLVFLANSLDVIL